MISLANSEERKYLLSKLAEYNYRPVRDFTYTYPEFKYSETELNQMYHDQERSDTIFNYSPDTDFSLTANELLRSITSQNTRVKYTKTVTWYINTYPLKITENMQIYATMLEEYVQHAAEIKLISVNPFTVDSNIWSNCQLLAIDDMPPQNLRLQMPFDLSGQQTIRAAHQPIAVADAALDFIACFTQFLYMFPDGRTRNAKPTRNLLAGHVALSHRAQQRQDISPQSHDLPYVSITIIVNLTNQHYNTICTQQKGLPAGSPEYMQITYGHRNA